MAQGVGVAGLHEPRAHGNQGIAFFLACLSIDGLVVLTTVALKKMLQKSALRSL